MSDVIRTSRGFAVVGDDGKVVSVHQDANEAAQALAEMEYNSGSTGNTRTATAFQGQPKPSVSGPGVKVAAPMGYEPPAGAQVMPRGGGPPAQMPATMPDLSLGNPQFAAARARSNDLGPGPENMAYAERKQRGLPDQPAGSIAPVEMTGAYQAPPQFKVHQHGGAFLLLRDGEVMQRYDDEGAALEGMNLHRYAYSRGIDLGSQVPPDAPPLPAMARGQTGEAEEELGVTKRLTDPYYGQTIETRGLTRRE